MTVATDRDGRPLPPFGTRGALLRYKPPYPTRQKSAKGQPPERSDFARRCHRCGASFLGLAAGRTGEAGLWRDWAWFCSQECFDA